MKVKHDRTPEQELLVLASRLTFNEESKERLIYLVQETKIKWFEFYKMTLYHKTLTLCWQNIRTFCPHLIIPRYLKDIILGAMISLDERNRIYQKELADVLAEFKKNDLVCIPVKGSYLIPNMYKNYGLRYSGDADFLVRHMDIPKMEDIMRSLGFIKGKYNRFENKIDPISRTEEIKWKMTMSNLPPFLRLNDNLFTPFLIMDFRFALDDTLNKEPINEIIDGYIKKGVVDPGYVLTHLCTHFYGEATYTLTIFEGKDMSLIKLCDIREYILQYMDDVSIESCICFAKKYGLEKQIYYTMFFLEFVYGDGYESAIMQKLGISDTKFLNEFGENQLGEKYTYQKGFHERIFSCGNSDEMLEAPKFYKAK